MATQTTQQSSVELQRIEQLKIDMQDNDTYEIENEFVIDLPDEQAAVIKEILETDAETLKDRLSIKMSLEESPNVAWIKVDDNILKAEIRNLPTPVSTFKTLDKKYFYKVTDISKIFICRQKDPFEEDTDVVLDHPHGLTPPMFNAHNKLRQETRKRHMDDADIRKIVKQLLRDDFSHGGDVEWMVVDDNNIIEQCNDKSKIGKFVLTGEHDATFPSSSTSTMASTSKADDEKQRPTTHQKAVKHAKPKGDTDTTAKLSAKVQELVAKQKAREQNLQKKTAQSLKKKMPKAMKIAAPPTAETNTYMEEGGA